MPEFSEKEQKIIREMVDHYENIDEMRDDVKEKVDSLFKNDMANFIDKNYAEFINNPDDVLQSFVVKFMRDNGQLFNNSMNEGIRYIESIL